VRSLSPFLSLFFLSFLIDELINLLLLNKMLMMRFHVRLLLLPSGEKKKEKIKI